jgi:hypothetical protein
MSMEILFQKYTHEFSNILLVPKSDSDFRENLRVF